jgi:hypothetical protein
MAMKLDKVVPFGRSLDEYMKMFNLLEIDLQKNIISLADGTASFNAEATLRGGKIISVDPIYYLTSTEINQRFNEVVDNINVNNKYNFNRQNHILCPKFKKFL